MSHSRFFKLSQIAILTLSFFTTNFADASTPINLKTKPSAFLNSLPGNVKETSRTLDFNHTLHIRFQQTFANYPVWGADGVMHVPNATRTTKFQFANNSKMNGTIYQNLQDDLVRPPISYTSKNISVSDHAIHSYLEKHHFSSTISEKIIEPIVFVDKKNKAHWAFHVSFLRELENHAPSRPNLIIDATSGEIYKEWDNVQTLENTLAGGTGGNEKIGKYIYDNLSSNFPALEITRDSEANLCYLQNDEVTLLNNKDSNDKIATFPCAEIDSQHNNLYWHEDEDTANGAYSPENDALFAGKIVINMYQDWYHIPPLVQDGNPMMLIMRLHLTGYENAFWERGRVTLGDGGDTSYPWVSLGIIAHEISHGFTEQHSKLVYSEQSGGLNESFSDMASVAAEYYLTGQNNWNIGYEVMKDPNLSLRYMDEPTKDCSNNANACSISNANDYNDSLNVHYTSGVFNKFFYLLATSPDWDVRKAFNIMVQANQNYWTANSTFIESACGVLSAARDYGYDSDTVIQAADQVGLDVTRC